MLESLQEFIGRKNIKNVQEQIKQTIQFQINKFVEDGTIHAPINQIPVKVETLWQSWSLIQKIKWIFLNYIGFGRWKIEVYDLSRKILLDAFKTFDEEQRDLALTNFDEKYKPWYYESQPKRVIVADVYFNSVKPLNYVKCDVIINKKGEIL